MTVEPLFWCVWAENGGSPTVKHAEYASAKREAKRLARNNPGQRFVVLAAAAGFVKDDVREVRFSHNAESPWRENGHPSGCMCLDCEVPF